MLLTDKQRRRLIEEIQQSFDADDLDAFLTVELGAKGLTDYASDKVRFPIQVIQLVRRLESQKLAAFVRVLAEHPGPSAGGIGPNPALKAFAAELLTQTPIADPDIRPSLFGSRPFINRDQLWRQIAAFAEGRAAQRILVIYGTKGSGKSHSQYLVSHWCSGRGQLIRINLANSTTPEASAAELIQPIAAALEVEFERRFDDLAQEARYTTWLGDRLVAHLKSVDQDWWILIDGLNLERVGDDVLQLVIRLAEAVDIGECPRLWLVLIGLEPVRLKGDLPEYVRKDETVFPTAGHVKEWLQRLADEHRKELQEGSLTAAMTKLDAVLNGGARDHRFWRPFLTALGTARGDLGLAEG